MTKSPKSTDFGTCSCEDINAISDESDRPCVDASAWSEEDAPKASAATAVTADKCPKEPLILKK